MNWFNLNLYFCRRGRENQRRLTKNSFVFKKDASEVEYVGMAEQEKTKHHPGGLTDKADEGDPKMFSIGEANCPVQFLKKLFRLLIQVKRHCFRGRKENSVLAMKSGLTERRSA